MLCRRPTREAFVQGSPTVLESIGECSIESRKCSMCCIRPLGFAPQRGACQGHPEGYTARHRNHPEVPEGLRQYDRCPRGSGHGHC
jgi:hypothetical protein